MDEKIFESDTEDALPLCFHYVDTYGNCILNKIGNIIASSIAVERNNSKISWCKYIHHQSESVHHCLICKKVFKTSSNKDSNIITHIKSCHYEVITMKYCELPEKYINKCTHDWEQTKLHVEKEVSNGNKTATSYGKQMDNSNSNKAQHSYFAACKPVKLQKTAMVKAICLGCLPLTFLHNKGKNKYLIIIIKVLYTLFYYYLLPVL